MSLRGALLMALLSMPASAMACSCASTLSLETAYANSEHVAVVRVMSVRTESERVSVLVIDSASDEPKPTTEKRRYLVGVGRVISTLKGAPTDAVAIRAVHRSTNCHEPLQAGSDYLLFWDDELAYHSYCQKQPLLTDVPIDLLTRWGYRPR
jgi:hypothetical protein